MKILRKRNRLQQVLFYVRWQLVPVAIALPGHLRFIVRGFGATVGAPKRLGLALRMCRIHLSLECGHAPLELLTIAEDIISLPPSIPGAVVECGTWLGGSTSKLSLACAAVGRRLFACDSIQGLPDLSDADGLKARSRSAAGTLRHSSTSCVRMSGGSGIFGPSPSWPVGIPTRLGDYLSTDRVRVCGCRSQVIDRGQAFGVFGRVLALVQALRALTSIVPVSQSLLQMPPSGPSR